MFQLTQFQSMFRSSLHEKVECTLQGSIQFGWFPNFVRRFHFGPLVENLPNERYGKFNYHPLTQKKNAERQNLRWWLNGW